MNLGASTYPAIAVAAVFIVISSLPIWFAARVVRADHPTLVRSALSLILGTVGAIVGITFGGTGVGLFIAPASYLLAFKFVLGTSIFGAVILAVMALAGYAAMSHLTSGMA